MWIYTYTCRSMYVCGQVYACIKVYGYMCVYISMYGTCMWCRYNHGLLLYEKCRSNLLPGFIPGHEYTLCSERTMSFCFKSFFLHLTWWKTTCPRAWHPPKWVKLWKHVNCHLKSNTAGFANVVYCLRLDNQTGCCLKHLKIWQPLKWSIFQSLWLSWWGRCTFKT